SPSPGQQSTGSTLLAIGAVSSSDVWAVGERAVQHGDERTLIEHWDGSRWGVVSSPNVPGQSSSELWGVTAIASDDAWAIGFSLDDSAVGSTLAEHWDGTTWTRVPTPAA